MKQDPICKKEVDKDTSFQKEYDGETYYFCSSECLKTFTEMKKSVIRLKRSLDEKKRVSFGKLNKDVIKPGICTLCGACAASCESITIENKRPKIVGPCTSCGVCYNQCPRTITTEEELVGKLRFAYSAKSLLSQHNGQDGGAVTALLAYGLEEGLIDCAVVTTHSKDQPWKPVAIIAEDRAEVLESSGSMYSHSMTMEQLMQAIQQGMRSIAFVGPSCNIDAVHKMQRSPYGFLHMFMRANVLRLGLFCMDTFSYEGIKEFVENHGMRLADIEAMKIRKGKFEFEQAGQISRFSLSEFDEYRSTSCKFCTDMAAENSDISFGGVGTPDGYTTVFARSSIGYEIFNEAVENGFLEARPLADYEMDRVLNLARMKKVQMYGVNRRSKKT